MVEKADYRAWNDVEVFDVPSDLRRPDAEAVAEHVKFYGLEELFPGTGLQEKFNSDAAFRTAIRRAIRNDLFVPDPNASDKVNAAISSLSSSLMVNWKTSRTGYASLSRVFADDGVENLTGEIFHPDARSAVRPRESRLVDRHHEHREKTGTSFVAPGLRAGSIHGDGWLSTRE